MITFQADYRARIQTVTATEATLTLYVATEEPVCFYRVQALP